jgi:hypothetical protein
VGGVGIYRGKIGLVDSLDESQPLNQILSGSLIGLNRKNCGSHKNGLGPKWDNIKLKPKKKRVIMVTRC